MKKSKAEKARKLLREVVPEETLPEAPAKSKRASKLRYRERITRMKRKGFTHAQARRIVDSVIEDKSSFKVGMLVQYHDSGLRAGYLADVPKDGQVKIQPIGPKGHEIEWCPRYVKLENVLQISNEYLKGENDMASIAKKAAELKKLAANAAAEKSEQGKKNVANLAKARAAKAPEEPKAKKAPKAKKEGNGNVGRPSGHEDSATITAGKVSPFREGSARATLLALAIKSHTVGKFIANAGKPSGGSATAYLSLFVRGGFVKIS